ncbi:unnamed protein product [Lymnaea stagnalis]|uniref:BZIP domain-containing protein n=1 Tax=Lymnaea stagnalis TaxID=6523 RepID=A0AAV2HVD1_LYMST
MTPDCFIVIVHGRRPSEKHLVKMFKDDSSDDELSVFTQEILEEITPESPLVKAGEGDHDVQLGDDDDLISCITSPSNGHSDIFENDDILSDESTGTFFLHELPSTSRELTSRHLTSRKLTSRDPTVHGISGAEFLVIPSTSSGRAPKRHLSLDEPGTLKHIYTKAIKEEIRCKIQLKRINEGQEELTVDYTPPQPTISYEAVKRRNEVREKNKMYAKQSRERIREEREKLENENIKLIAMKTTLEEEIKRMERTIEKIAPSVDEHDKRCSVPEPSSEQF